MVDQLKGMQRFLVSSLGHQKSRTLRHETENHTTDQTWYAQNEQVNLPTVNWIKNILEIEHD